MNLSPKELQSVLHPPDLPAELRRLVRGIPSGRIVSFGDLAEALGDLKAARWVAQELQLLDADEFPVHRVIRRTGQVIGTAQLPIEGRLARLRAEGVEVTAGKIDLGHHGFCIATTAKPLEHLQAIQDRVAKAIDFTPLKSLPERIAGVDVSYGSEGIGVAAYAVVDAATGTLLQHELLCEKATFPYVPGYLSFREIPLLARLLERVKTLGRLEPIVMVDGNGILHPRCAGIATMLGVVAGVRTIGVSKHLLCGKVFETGGSHAEIRTDDGRLMGYRLRRDSKRSILYVSPGTGVDAAGALRLTQSQIRGRRLPDPIHHADRLSREAIRSRGLRS